MSVQIAWLEPNRILMTTYSGHVTGTDFAQASEAAFQTMDVQPVAILADLSSITGFEPNFVNMQLGIKLMNHPNMRGMAIITSSGLMNFIAKALGAGLRFKLFHSLEEAMAYLDTQLQAA
ncbi:MAG TPA: STAS/SEC14 domain-containing protein [Aggregatilineales bacterium]|nr:STAS/SEC14 domain-containing protein [Aggregatilineales bacterium]